MPCNTPRPVGVSVELQFIDQRQLLRRTVEMLQRFGTASPARFAVNAETLATAYDGHVKSAVSDLAQVFIEHARHAQVGG